MEEKEIKKKIAEKIKEIEEAAAEKPVEKGLPSDKDIPVAEDQPAAKAKPDDDNQSVDKDKPAAEEQPAGENQQAAADKPAEEDRPADADKPADEKQSDDADKPDDKGTPFAEDHQPAADKPADEKQQAAKKRKSGKKKGLRLPSLKNPSRRAMRILLLLEILFLSLVVLVFTRSVSLNKDDRILPADAGTKDTVSCMDGSLTVNNITTKVPSKGNVVYNIAYSWGKNDTDHPSVPHAAVATYSNDSGRSLFELSLYRDSYTPKRKIPKGKNAANWFEGWEQKNGENYKSSALKTGVFSGFLISGIEKGAESSSSYSTSTYYFATETKKGVSVYVLEGVLYDPASSELFQKSFDYARASLSFKDEA